jgi:hypothetical protein
MSEEEIITTVEELGRALREQRKILTIEGPLTSTVIAVRLIDDTTGLLVVSIIGGASAFFAMTLGAGIIVSLLISGGVAAIIGFPAAKAIAEIVVATRGVAALHDLRHYVEVERIGDHIVLKR